ELDNKNSDFIFIEQTEAEKAADVIVELCAETLPQKYGIKPSDIQVLSPMRMGVIGTGNLNTRLQNALNPNGISIKYGFGEFRVNDKVMQIRNNYEKQVFNGDIGFISNIDKSTGVISVIFDSTEAEYEREEFNEIVLAYATTIHKSQGSEFPFVIMPIMMTHYIMLQRNLLYTGVTRAKKGLILVGEKRAVFMAVKNNKIQERNTKLATRLKNYAY
ncbi:MAG: ATP-binding domain-containing protein, partial [Synergistaceae bacterium]|nr:ATP-binding domain-containing protein [Synergistaceae bacterium]